MFFKCIWSGGKERVKRKILYNDYLQCGLKMINPSAYALTQKMTWVKYLFDENYDSVWKTIELSALETFHRDPHILWNHMPQNQSYNL